MPPAGQQKPRQELEDVFEASPYNLYAVVDGAVIDGLPGLLDKNNLTFEPLYLDADDDGACFQKLL